MRFTFPYFTGPGNSVGRSTRSSTISSKWTPATRAYSRRTISVGSFLSSFVVRNSCVWDIALNSQLSVQLRLRKAERVTNLSKFDCQASGSWTCSTHQNVPPDGIKLSLCDLLVSVAADSGWLRLGVAVSMSLSCSTAKLISQQPQSVSYACVRSKSKRLFRPLGYQSVRSKITFWAGRRSRWAYSLGPRRL